MLVACATLSIAFSPSRADTPATTTSVIKYSDDAPPMREIVAKQNQEIQAFAYSHDGKSIYLPINDKAINLWEVSVYYWPEVLGALVGLLTLACLLRIVRICRARRLVGEPYCRKCNYCLRGTTSERCPECGQPSTRVVIGRSMKRRLMPTMMVAVMFLGSYGFLWAAKTPRTGLMSNYLNWWSCDLCSWATSRNQIWLQNHTQRVTRVVEIGADAGQETRTVFTAAGRLDDAIRPSFCASPKSSHVAIQLTDPIRWLILDTGSGKVENCVEGLDVPASYGSRLHEIIGFDSTGENLFGIVINETTEKGNIIAWNTRTSALSAVLECEAESDWVRKGKTRFTTSIFTYIPHSSPARFVENRLYRGFFSRDSKLLIRDSAQPTKTKKGPSSAFDASGGNGPVLSPDGRRCFGSKFSPTGDSLVQIDLETMHERRLAMYPDRMSPTFVFNPANQTVGDLLLIGGSLRIRRQKGVTYPSKTSTKGLLVFDLKSTKWRGFYPLPDDEVVLGTALAPDNRSAAVLAFRGENPNKYKRQLFLYDLSNLPDELDMTKLRSSVVAPTSQQSSN
jgi:hypothetical protein